MKEWDDGLLARFTPPPAPPLGAMVDVVPLRNAGCVRQVPLGSWDRFERRFRLRRREEGETTEVDGAREIELLAP
jgi:hypothetical protein